jgi:hypothetical protein
MFTFLLTLACPQAPGEKYSTNRFHFFLVLDPVAAHSPRPQDYEEMIVVHPGVGLRALARLIREVRRITADGGVRPQRERTVLGI